MWRYLLAAICAAWVCGGSVEAQVKLEQKFPEGSKFASQSETKTHQVLTIAGMPLETDARQFTVAHGAVGKRTAEGDLSIETKIETLQIDLSLPGGIKLAFASSDPDKKAEIPQLQSMLDFYRVSSRAVSTTLLDRDNRIKSVESKLDNNEPIADEFKSQFNPAYRKKLAIQQMARLPEKLVGPGETWERMAEFDLGAGQTLTTQNRYEYTGTIEKDGMQLDKIVVVTIAVSYAMDPNSASPLKITGSELKPTESSGILLFDRASGAVVESQDTLRIEGTLKMTINNMELPGKLDLKIETKESLAAR
jgi:hypothetical protein